MLYPYQDNTELCGRKAHYVIVRGGGSPNLTFACDSCKDHFINSSKKIAEVMHSDMSSISLYRLEEEQV